MDHRAEVEELTPRDAPPGHYLPVVPRRATEHGRVDSAEMTAVACKCRNIENTGPVASQVAVSEVRFTSKFPAINDITQWLLIHHG